MPRSQEVENFYEVAKELLGRNGHKPEEIVCVLWGVDKVYADSFVSIEVGSFWEYAKKTNWDRAEWVSGPPCPLYMLSGKGWWLEVSEYDSRTYLVYKEEPKQVSSTMELTPEGFLRALSQR